jgi:hypothetical protein
MSMDRRASVSIGGPPRVCPNSMASMPGVDTTLDVLKKRVS